MTEPRRKPRPKRTPETDITEDLGPGRVWVTAGLNIQIAPFNSVSYSFGFSRTSPGDDKAAILKVEADMYRVCEQAVDRRVRELAELAGAVRTEYGLDD